MADIRRLIIETANAIGANPLDLATAISYETAGTFDPLKKGPRTQHGQHRGFIQFGEPQAARFGVDWNNPIASQLGADGAVAKYFKASGFKPGMSGLDLYSTINAGAPGLYNRSDANNGGAPGDVRDKWENQMAGHRAKAAALLGGDSMVPRDHSAQLAAQTNTPLSGQSGSDTLFGSGGLLSQPFNRPINPELAALAGDEEPSTMSKIGGLLSAIGEASPNAPQPNLGPMPDARQFGGLLQKYLGSMTRRA